MQILHGTRRRRLPRLESVRAHTERALRLATLYACFYQLAVRVAARSNARFSHQPVRRAQIAVVARLNGGDEQRVERVGRRPALPKQAEGLVAAARGAVGADKRAQQVRRARDSLLDSRNVLGLPHDSQERLEVVR